MYVTLAHVGSIPAWASNQNNVTMSKSTDHTYDMSLGEYNGEYVLHSNKLEVIEQLEHTLEIDTDHEYTCVEAEAPAVIQDVENGVSVGDVLRVIDSEDMLYMRVVKIQDVEYEDYVVQ